MTGHCLSPFLVGSARCGSRWPFSASSGPSQSRASAARNCCATCIGAERSRYRTRRRSPGSAVTRPASASSARCLAMAWRVIGSWPARSVAVAGPPAASAARMARRLGSAGAVKPCSAIASLSADGIEVVGEFAQLTCPPLGVAVVGRAVGVLGQLREPGLDHGEPRARAGRLQRELNVGAARIVLRQPVNVPGEAEYCRLFHPLHPHVGGVAAVPLHPRRAAGAQVDPGLVAEPGAQPLGRGKRRPYLGRWMGDFDGPLDAIRESNDYLHDVATCWLPYYGNQQVASIWSPGTLARLHDYKTLGAVV